jgi:hypothetical protein
VAGEFVVSSRHCYGEFPASPSVALGGTSRARPGTPGQPDVVSLEKALGLKPIKMEFRLVTGNSNRVRRLISAYRLTLRAHEAVQLAAYRIGQYADTGDVSVEAPQRSTPNGQMS